jgi:RNA-directed DNA polymerase
MDGSSFRDWGNGVFSFALPIPSYRKDGEVCVELLYEDRILTIPDSENRRLYRTSEFDPKNGRHLSEQVYTLYPDRRTLIAEKVFDMASGDNVALSKADFAKRISERAPGVADVDFSGFYPIFQEIQQIRQTILTM